MTLTIIFSTLGLATNILLIIGVFVIVSLLEATIKSIIECLEENDEDELENNADTNSNTKEE